MRRIPARDSIDTLAVAVQEVFPEGLFEINGLDTMFSHLSGDMEEAFQPCSDSEVHECSGWRECVLPDTPVIFQSLSSADSN